MMTPKAIHADLVLVVGRVQARVLGDPVEDGHLHADVEEEGHVEPGDAVVGEQHDERGDGRGGDGARPHARVGKVVGHVVVEDREEQEEGGVE